MDVIKSFKARPDSSRVVRTLGSSVSLAASRCCRRSLHPQPRRHRHRDPLRSSQRFFFFFLNTAPESEPANYLCDCFITTAQNRFAEIAAFSTVHLLGGGAVRRRRAMTFMEKLSRCRGAPGPVALSPPAPAAPPPPRGGLRGAGSRGERGAARSPPIGAGYANVSPYLGAGSSPFPLCALPPL